MIKRILPSVTNEVITLVKDTSLAFVVAVSEMFTIAKQIASAQTTMNAFCDCCCFFLFALTAFILVLIGVKQYKSTANAMNYNYEVRTVTSYLREKVRQNDSDAAISVETINGTKALCLKNTINDIVYNTFIYYYDGSLRELYVQDGSSYSLDSGQMIVEIGGLDMTETTDKMINRNLSPIHPVALPIPTAPSIPTNHRPTINAAISRTPLHDMPLDATQTYIPQGINHDFNKA